MNDILFYLQGLDPMILVAILGVLVFTVVKILDLLNFLPTGTLKRVAVFLTSVASTEMFEDAQRVISTVLIMLVSVVLNEIGSKAGSKVKKRFAK